MCERCITNPPHLVHAAILSILFAASRCSAYTPNVPAASRYLREMGKLLHDPQLQAYAPAQTLEPTTERDSTTYSFEDNPPTSLYYYPPQPPIEEPHEQFSSEADLFDALNHHIEALDKQIKTSRVDVGLHQPESKLEYTTYDDANDPIPSSLIESQELYESDHFDTYIGETTEYYYPPPPEEKSYETYEYYEITDDYQSPDHYQSTEQTIYDDTDHYETEEYYTEESYENAYTEYSEMESEYHQDGSHNELLEEASYEHYVPNQKKEELAIQKRKGVPQLPITNDPFELLGLDYDNPPKTEKDIKRAFLKMAKKYHPDAVSVDATTEEKDAASKEFTRINTAYRAVKEMLKQYEADKQFHDDLITTGGPGGSMYDRRTAHIRRPFSRVNGDFDSSFSSGSGSSAKHRTREDLEASRSFWLGRKPNANQYGQSRTPFRYRQDVGDSCHVGVSFPPFSNF